jgi:phosphoribosyl-ATP pyrophosphohydrolase/phosphoribosyl-AMP cyclohydrolase/histidinol dehydrogenase
LILYDQNIGLFRIQKKGIMSCLPFPSFVDQIPVDASNKRAALSAAGSCRIDPSKCAQQFIGDYEDICNKNKEQALVDCLEGSISKDEKKKMKKKYMKQGVAMASTYLTKMLQLDVSVVNVQVVLDPSLIIETDGCISACLLDAGCTAIVIDGKNLEAMDAAKIPRERIVASFQGGCAASKNEITAALALASTISVPISSLEEAEIILSYIPEKTDNVIFELSNADTSSATTEFVAAIAKKCKDGKGKIALVDPCATTLGTNYAACMRTDRPDGLYTTVVCTRNNEALGLVYSSVSSIIAAFECGRGVYYSRSRNGLWRKGDTSGHYQTLHRLDVDCDGDALRFTVTQCGGITACFCHLYTLTCWGEPNGLRHLEQTMKERLESAPEGSYTKRLFDDPQLLRDKLVEEAQELSEAETKEEVAGELADLLYFAMARAAKAGVSIDDAVAVLDSRTRKVTRRKGDSKVFRIEAGEKILGNK